MARSGQPVGGRPLPAAVLEGADSPILKVVAGGDLHCDGGRASLLHLREAALVAAGADLVLLAGDLTANGRPAEAAAVVEAFAGIRAPVVAVLGNHDLAGSPEAVARVLEEGGVTVLRSRHEVLDTAGVQVGIAGTTGCAGGFHGRPVPGLSRGERREQRLRVSAECGALEAGLRAIASCRPRIVLMHYSPTTETLQGEPARLLPLLGCDRFAVPIADHAPDLVVHGHAHHGTLEGRIDRTPVFNVALAPEPWRFHELAVAA